MELVSGGVDSMQYLSYIVNFVKWVAGLTLASGFQFFFLDLLSCHLSHHVCHDMSSPPCDADVMVKMDLSIDPLKANSTAEI